jgi:hypothetical protein
MKSLIFMLFSSFVSFNVVAGTCSNGSLLGQYNYEFTGVQPYNTSIGIYSFSKHNVGRINFNGAGSVAFSGIETSSGRAISVNGSGSYTVSATCTGYGTIITNYGVVLNYWIYLDQMDDAPVTRLAYHATLAIKNNQFESASGTITKVIGKFQ